MSDASGLREAPAGFGLCRGERALITGASSGIGETFARTLAARGVSLMLTARPEDADRLTHIGDELGAAHGIPCHAVAADLAGTAGVDRLRAAAEELAFEPDLIVNSAGFGIAGRFAELDLGAQMRMIDLNVSGLVRLTGHYLPRMRERHTGAIVNIASTAAFQPNPYFAIYGASKTFVLKLSEALWAESQPYGVRVVVVSSGPVETPFHGGPDEATQRGLRGFVRRRYLTTQDVVDAALGALVENRPSVVLRVPVVGLLYYPVTLLAGLLPTSRRLRMAERFNRRLYEVDAIRADPALGAAAEPRGPLAASGEEVSMAGKVVLVTGASAGLGLAAAHEIAARGATVVLAGRSAERCAAAAESIRAGQPAGAVDWIVGDLSTQVGVRDLAAEFRRRYDRLDVLINNAGTMEAKAEYTIEGVERTLAVNHLAPFLLTNLLADLLVASAPARVITVASVAHERARIDFDDIEMRKGYRMFPAYARSKLANVLFTYELARRLDGTGVTANAMNPGLVRTGLGRGKGVVGELGYRLTHLVFRKKSLTPELGADTIVFLACSPHVETVSGKYFFERKPMAPSEASQDPAAARRLWELSERWTGQSWPGVAPQR